MVTFIFLRERNFGGRVAAPFTGAPDFAEQLYRLMPAIIGRRFERRVKQCRAKLEIIMCQHVSMQSTLSCHISDS